LGSVKRKKGSGYRVYDSEVRSTDLGFRV
jgi:hypothetical protein